MEAFEHVSCTSGELADEGQKCFNEMASLVSARAELSSRELENVPDFVEGAGKRYIA